MIFITAKFPVKPEHADKWADITRDFTAATNAEEGCLFFEWSRSLEEPETYVLVEAFRDDESGAIHVQSDHFKKATTELPPYLSATPDIVNARVDGWSKLGEMAVD
ncbi:antibiotic biosynthesis monooxygenase [Pseudarthrobacter sp. R1]|uniref:putative quinol monooxygenase n=1 Tax=Pseudarthrobacter sp. R1 TaxID=2944934 RepID=UPI00210AC052|nr:putative quinol monooxygenase [Pseudarthrobacter sp. R1]MCQ6269322.1 antibiotic biosynthesis monooxygenase [Pseudarthrobacter sp. R1]